MRNMYKFIPFKILVAQKMYSMTDLLMPDFPRGNNKWYIPFMIGFCEANKSWMRRLDGFFSLENVILIYQNWCAILYKALKQIKSRALQNQRLWNWNPMLKIFSRLKMFYCLSETNQRWNLISLTYKIMPKTCVYHENLLRKIS